MSAVRRLQLVGIEDEPARGPPAPGVVRVAIATREAVLGNDLAMLRGAVLARFRADSRFETWLLGIAYNRFRSLRRQRKSEAPPSGPEAGEGSEPPAERLTDLQQDLASAMVRLSEHEQTALRLCFQFGLSHAEIATATGWPLGTVKTHIARGKGQLRELLSVWNPQT